jgi:protein-L-isoaspartate(D-aspartate) O-methyltransferase
MNVEQARFNMVEQQIRTWEVLDQDVLDLLFEVKPRGVRAAAHRGARLRGPGDAPARPGPGQHMLQPKVEARVLQELAPRSRTRSRLRGRHRQRLSSRR